MPKKLNVGGLSSGHRLSEQTIDPDEVPELTEEYFRRAAIYDGETLVRPGRGRPKLAAPKQLTSLRLDPVVIAAFRASGPGWQTRVNAVLKAYVQRKRTARGSRLKVNTALAAARRRKRSAG
jgi:uncharacterized protein (DUF4415 family)